MNHIFQSFYLDSPLIPGRIFDIFEPETVTCDTALFIVHGGGWRYGSRTGFHRIMEAFNKHGILCASTDYRLTGVTALEQITDIRASYDRFITYLKGHKLPLKIAVYGVSAGAHLASLMICAKPGECGEENHLVNDWLPPIKGILQSTPAQFTPWEDIFPGIWTSMQDIAGVPYEKEPQRYEALSLKNYIRPDNPPLFFAEAQNEHMFPSEYTLALKEKQCAWGLTAKWKVYTHMEHGFFYDLDRPQQREFFQDILDFITANNSTH